MSDTDDIIDLQIAVSDKAPELPNFGMPILVDYHTAWVDYAREYSRPDDVLDDGFTVNDSIYKMALALKSQSPAPPSFKVGRLETIPTQIVDLIPAVTTQGFIYNGVINGTTLSYTVPGAATTQSVVEAIELLVEAVTGITSTEDNAKITATSTAGLNLDFNWDRGMKVLDVTTDAGFAADIAKIVDEDDDWYGLVLGRNSDAYVAAGAAWTEARTKLFFPHLSGWDVIDAGVTNDTGSDLVAQAYNRTGAIWHRAIGGDEWAAAAFAGVILGRDPGKATPAFKTLAGIAVDDLRTGERTALKNKNVTRYVRQGGSNITFEGKAPSGRYLDVTRNVDFMEAQVRANIFATFVNNDVVPYTDAGISLIKGAIESALQTCAEMGIIVAGYVVTVPKVAATATADRAQRILRNVEFTARLAGAIHRVVVRGTVSV